MWGIKVEVAQYYINNLSEEVKKGQKEKVQQGWLPTKPPIGYKTVGEKGHKTHVIDEDKAPLVRRMFELYASGGYTLFRLYKKMRDEGLRTKTGCVVSRSRMAELLGDPFYIGQIRWNGLVHPAKHEPLISYDLFQRCQTVIHGRGAAKYRRHVFLFKGLVKCKECGGLLIWERQKGIVYGHCSPYRRCVPRTWYKEVDFEWLITEQLRRFRLADPELSECVRNGLKELHASEIGYREATVKELHDRQTRLRQRQDILYSDRLDRRISTELYDQKRLEIENEIQSVLTALQRHVEGDKRYFDLGSNMFELSQLAPDIFNRQSTNLETRQKLITLVCKEIYVENGALAIVLSDEFYTLALLAQRMNGSKHVAFSKSPRKIFELQKSPLFVVRNGASLPDLPVLLAWWSFFRTTNLLEIIPHPDYFSAITRELLAVDELSAAA